MELRFIYATLSSQTPGELLEVDTLILGRVAPAKFLEPNVNRPDLATYLLYPHFAPTDVGRLRGVIIEGEIPPSSLADETSLATHLCVLAQLVSILRIGAFALFGFVL